jgi:hypothetical protein
MAKRNLTSLFDGCGDDGKEDVAAATKKRKLLANLSLHDIKGRYMSPKTAMMLQRIDGHACTKCKRNSYCSIVGDIEQYGVSYRTFSDNDAGRTLIVDLSDPEKPCLFLCTYCTYLEIAHLSNMTLRRQRTWFSQDFRPLKQTAADYLARSLIDKVVTKLMVIVLPESRPVTIDSSDSDSDSDSDKDRKEKKKTKFKSTGLDLSEFSDCY